MSTPDFERSFRDFLDRREYDKAENALFSMVRIAYLAGWKAAGGAPVPSQPVLELRHKTHVLDLKEIETDIKE